MRLTKTISRFDADGESKVERSQVPHGGPGFAYAFRAGDAAAAAEADRQVADLVGYLNWMSEPTAGTRRKVGSLALGFLVDFIAVGRWLNSVYWRYLPPPSKC